MHFFISIEICRVEVKRFLFTFAVSSQNSEILEFRSIFSYFFFTHLINFLKIIFQTANFLFILIVESNLLFFVQAC
jgi:hypothetical protein